MKIQKTQQYASIYLLTFLIFCANLISGCAERQEKEPENEPVISVNETYNLLVSGLINEKIEELPNGTVSRSTWVYTVTDCQLTIKEEVAYKRQKAPFGGFKQDQFLAAWESTRTLALADLDPSLLQSKGPHIKLHTLAHKNLIKEENLYSEAYLAYYKAENGDAHPAQSQFDYNLITLFQKEPIAPTPATEHLKLLITHCQAN
ncbi:MAG: hypothetical protein AAFN10_15260 [Bacteroidota bacterium]